MTNEWNLLARLKHRFQVLQSHYGETPVRSDHAQAMRELAKRIADMESEMVELFRLT